MSDQEDDERQVFVRFRTRLAEHAITDDRIAVPTKLRRLGLSQVVNHLLGKAGSISLDLLAITPSQPSTSAHFSFLHPNLLSLLIFIH